MKLFTPAVIVLSLASCQNTPVRPTFNYQDHLGLAVEKGGRACLYIPNPGLSPGQRVQFVTASTPQTTGEVEILGKGDDSCKDSDQEGTGVARYTFKVIRGELGRAAPAFAIAGYAKPLTPSEEGVSADLDGDGQLEFFRSCTSTEGVHLTIWKGKPLKGPRRWHRYYYLGYDVTPDCTESDTKQDTGQ